LGILFTLTYHVLDNPSTPLASGLGIFKYFTILSNLVVVIYFWMMFSLKLDKSKKFDSWLGAVTVYITITGVIFAAFLQADFRQVGLDKVGSILNHYVIPILTIGFLLYYRKEYAFRFKDILKWMIFPVLYLMYLLIRGSITDDYLYPFFNINILGVGLVTLYTFGMIAFFGLLSFGAVILTNKKNKRVN
jgi:hypothetical protein